jgi:hypothetical protein
MAACAALLVALACATCGPRSTAPARGTFVEEFEGFPIFHGDPGRPYTVLGPVYDAAAAARGTSPMKRAAVAAARRLGADAIVIGLPQTPGEPQTGTPAVPASSGVQAKWSNAVAIDLGK